MHNKESKEKRPLRLASMKEMKGSKTMAAHDLLHVCLPTRAHLVLMPNSISICPSKRCSNGSPALFKANVKIDEPTSPKVTCAGQIKVRHNARPVEIAEYERSLHKMHKLRPTFERKRDIMQSVGAFRGLKFKLKCFSSNEDEDDEVVKVNANDDNETEEKNRERRRVITKWFKMLDEKESLYDDEQLKRKILDYQQMREDINSGSAMPPTNALLLMRCRSSPSKGCLKEEKKKEEIEKERLVLKNYDSVEFLKLSTEIAKETWVVGSIGRLARSKSLKR